MAASSPDDGGQEAADSGDGSAEAPSGEGSGEVERAFLQWLRDEGSDVSKVLWPVRDRYGGRIATAAVDVPAEEFALRVPEHLLMTPSAAERSDMGEYVTLHGLRGDVLLSAFVLFEMRKGAASFWAPFLRMLPEVPETVCNWGDACRAQLSDGDLVARADSRDRWVADLHERYFATLLSARYEDVFPPAFYSAERFRFAWHVVQSRAFGRKLKETALVPFADCLNHGGDVACSYRLRDGAFELYPTQDGVYVGGTELLNTYGPAPNSKLLLDYGFALLDNRHDRVKLPLALKPLDEDPLLPRRRALLRRAGATAFPTLLLATGDVPDEAVCFLRAALADETALETLEARDVLTVLDPLDAAFEDRLHAYLDDLLEKLERACGPPRAQDEKTLADLDARASKPGAPEETFHELFAVRYRATRVAIVASVRAATRDARADAPPPATPP